MGNNSSDATGDTNVVHLTIFSDNQEEVAMVATRSEPVERAMATLLERLDTAEMTLQSANFRIGYLQAEIDKYKDNLRVLPDVQTVSRKTAEAQRRHEELVKQLPEMERRLQRLPKMQQDHDLLLEKVEQACARPQGQWWQIWKRF